MVAAVGHIDFTFAMLVVYAGYGEKDKGWNVSSARDCRKELVAWVLSPLSFFDGRKVDLELRKQASFRTGAGSRRPTVPWSHRSP